MPSGKGRVFRAARHTQALPQKIPQNLRGPVLGVTFTRIKETEDHLTEGYTDQCPLPRTQHWTSCVCSRGSQGRGWVTGVVGTRPSGIHSPHLCAGLLPCEGAQIRGGTRSDRPPALPLALPSPQPTGSKECDPSASGFTLEPSPATRGNSPEYSSTQSKPRADAQD